MNAAKINSGDLLLKIVDGPEGSVIPVKSVTCLLKEMDNSSGVRLECSLLRDAAGVTVKSASEGVTINGSLAFGQRLKLGDQICLGNKTYEIIQLGSLANETDDQSVEVVVPRSTESSAVGEKLQLVRVAKAKTTPYSQMTEQLTESEPQMSSDQINNRIDRIESELGRQSENFENVNKRFDDLGQQMAALINAVGGGNAPAGESVTDEAATASQAEVSDSSARSESQVESVESSVQSTENRTTTAPVETTEANSILDAQPEVQPSSSTDTELVEEPVAQEPAGLSSQGTSALDLDSVFEQRPAEEPVAALTEDRKPQSGDTAPLCDGGLTDVFNQGECADSCSGQCEESNESTSQQLNDVASDDQRQSLNDVFQGLDTTTTDDANLETNSQSNESSEQLSTDDSETAVDATTTPESLTEDESQRMLDRLSALTGTSNTPVNDDSEGETTDQVAAASQTETTEAVAEISNQQLENDAEQTLDSLLSSLNSISGNEEDVVSEESVVSNELQAETSEPAETTGPELTTSEPTEATPSDSAEESGQLEDLFASLREKDRLAEENEQLEAEQDSEIVADEIVADEIVADTTDDQPVAAETPEAGSLSAGLLEAIANDDVQDKPTLSLREQMGISIPATSPGEEELTSEPVENKLLRDLEEDPNAQQEKPVLSLREQMGLSDLNTTPSSEEETQETQTVDSLVNEPQADVEPETSEEQSAADEDVSTQSSVADILSRMNMLPTEESDGASGLVENVEPEPVQTAPTAEPVEAAAGDEPQSVEDVQDYMNSLLQRLNGGEPAAAKPVEEEKPEAAPLEKQVEPEPVKSSAPVIPVKPMNPEEFVPSRSAPERSSDLAAMRELANASSRNAVQRSQINKRKIQSTNLLVTAIVGALAAITTAVMSQQTGDGFYLMSLALFLVTTVASGLYAATNFFGMELDLPKLFLKLLKGKKRRFTNGISALSDDAEISEGQELSDTEGIS